MRKLVGRLRDSRYDGKMSKEGSKAGLFSMKRGEGHVM